MMINDAMRTDLDRSVLCWLATVDAEGVPSVTPKEIFAAHGDSAIIIADIASANSVRNITNNPNVCVSFIDIFRQKGFKVIGTATVFAAGSDAFSAAVPALAAKAGSNFPIRNVIRVEMTRVSRILAPSYHLFPERGEAQRVQEAYDTYGVRPAD